MKLIISKITSWMYRHSFWWRYYYDNKGDDVRFNNPKVYNSKEEDIVAIAFNGNVALNKVIVHGGLADRLKGITSVYKVCKEMGKTFKIDHISPYKLNHFLVPNHYNWYIKHSKVERIQSAESHILDDLNLKSDNKYFYRRLKLLCRRKHPLIVYSNAHIASDEEFRLLFLELFKPSELLKTAIQENLNRIKGDYISISYRFTHVLGDPIDVYIPELPQEEKVALIEKSILCIHQIHSEYPKLKILVNSDSAIFLDRVKLLQLPFVYITPGTPVHIDQDLESDDISYLKTFVDFYMISMAKKVILVKSEKMYNSAFPRYAAIMGNKDFSVVNI